MVLVGTVTGKRIELVEEQDARYVRRRESERVVDLRGCLTNPFRHGVGGAHIHEREAELARAGREQGLADARRTVQQHTVPTDAVLRGELLRVDEQCDDISELLLDRVESTDVGEALEMIGRRRFERRDHGRSRSLRGALRHRCGRGGCVRGRRRTHRAGARGRDRRDDRCRGRPGRASRPSRPPAGPIARRATARPQWCTVRLPSTRAARRG